MNRLDETLTQHLRRNDAADEASGARVLEALSGPLPRQRHSLFEHWPSLFLTRDFMPAWPRLAGLAFVGLLGCMAGIAAPSLQKSAAASIRIADVDVGVLAFESEPISGVRQ